MSSTPSKPQLNLIRLSLIPYSALFSGPCPTQDSNQHTRHAFAVPQSWQARSRGSDKKDADRAVPSSSLHTCIIACKC